MVFEALFGFCGYIYRRPLVCAVANHISLIFDDLYV